MVSSQSNDNIMTAEQLIRSFMSQARWGQVSETGKSYNGVKWITAKQASFLWSLSHEGSHQRTSWEVDGYKVSLGETAPNGCKSMSFRLIESRSDDRLSLEKQLRTEQRTILAYYEGDEDEESFSDAKKKAKELISKLEVL